MAATQCAPGTDQPSVATGYARRESRIRRLTVQAAGSSYPVAGVAQMGSSVSPH
ncbi:hypothetical protein EDF19_3228 [Curtobacterium sp. PhB115]|nr:hypothetical protein EDF19_3228 [Curtobacterium sp. PhB115]